MENDINLDEELTVPPEVPESEMKINWNYVGEDGSFSVTLIPQWKPHSDYHNAYIEKCRKEAEELAKNKPPIQCGIWWPGKNGKAGEIKWYDIPNKTD
jgi:hypothetical protein